MSTIPAGYQIHTLSWENDGDNYKTTILSGLTQEDVKFYIDLANIFKGKYGNDFVKAEIIGELIMGIITKHPDITAVTKEEWAAALQNRDVKYEDHKMYQLLNKKLLSSPDENYGIDFCRAVDNIKVYFYPTDIVEVTEKFI